MIQASGQANWADPVWIEMFEYMEGQHITSSSSINLDMEWGCSLTAGTGRQLYCSICFIALRGTDVIYHYLFWVGVSFSSIVDHINKQFIIGGCFLSVDCSTNSGYGCYIGLDTIENYLILRTVVLAYIYGVGFTTPARAMAVTPRWTSGPPMLWPSLRCIPWQRCILWLRWLATVTFWSPVSNLVTFGASGILCRAVCSARWVLSCAVGQSLEGAGGVWPSPLWLGQALRCLSWQLPSTGLKLWETCSRACWMARWSTVMSVSSLEGVLKDLAISLSRSFPSWW